MDHRLHGKSAEDVFPEPGVAILARAACDGDEAAVSRAVKRGAEPNSVGFEGLTPLFWAVSCKNLRGVEALLRAGADPNHIAAKAQFSPVYYAVTINSPETLKVLLTHGGDPDTMDLQTRKTVLWQALSIGADERGWDCWYALLDAGADINRTDGAHNTIATDAEALGQFDKVAELLERGYTYDLTDLGRGAEIRVIAPNHPEAEWQRKVKAMLEQRGVHFPVPPRDQN